MLSSRIGSKINRNKTKYLGITKLHRKPVDLIVDNYRLEAIEQFKYLGTFFNNIGNSYITIKERIQIANKCYYAHSKLFRS